MGCLQGRVEAVIPVALAPEPESFKTKVRQPGKIAIAELVGEKPKRAKGKRLAQKANRRDDIPPSAFPPYWRDCLPEMLKAYDSICAFSCFRIHQITGAPSVDHMAPKSRKWDKVYEWENYRLACARMNARKLDFVDLIDPFEVQENWFCLELVGFSLYANSNLKSSLCKTLESAIDRLRLNDSDLRERRASDAEDYWKREISFEVLKRESPLVARELKRQNRLLS